MFQKASADDLFVDVDAMLHDEPSSGAASAAANPPNPPQTFGSPFSGAGKHFQPFHKCCNLSNAPNHSHRWFKLWRQWLRLERQ
jgi:hypothetical protein